MNEALCIFIWDKTKDVYTRSLIVTKKTKELKFKGRKPNKVIVPESCNDKVLLRNIKKICSHDYVKVTAKGK